VEAQKKTPESRKTRASGSVPCARCSSEDGDKKVNKIYTSHGKTLAEANRYLIYIYIHIRLRMRRNIPLVRCNFFFDLCNNNILNIVSLVEFPRENSTTGTISQSLSLSFSPLSRPTSECYRILYYIIIIILYS